MLVECLFTELDPQPFKALFLPSVWVSPNLTRMTSNLKSSYLDFLSYRCGLPCSAVEAS